MLFAVVMILPASLASAQDTTPRAAQVEGMVHDTAGKRVAGVAVHLQETGSPDSADAKTDADGHFALLVVRPGSYTVKLEKSGFRSVIVDSITLALGDKKHCDFVLTALTASASRSPVSASNPASPSSSPSNAITLDDRPNFTVAGVTDSTGSGGHGSETRIRTGEALAKETLSLESESKVVSGVPGVGGDLQQARERVDHMLAKEADLDTHQRADLRRLLGDLNEKLGDPLGAEQEYERAAGLDASERNYFAWGTELLLHGAAAPAIEVFGKGARLHPDSARMLAGLGAALYSSGSAEEAALRLCQASDLEPANLEPANSAPYLFLGQMQEAVPAALPCAEEKLARFARDQPANALANYYYALALWKRDRGSASSGTLELIESSLEKSAELDPKLDLACVWLGNVYLAQGESQKALAAYRKAVAINPDRGESHYRLGLIYKRMGEGAKAHVEFDEYKRIDKTEAAAIERQRRELRQFLFVLQEPPNAADSTPATPASMPKSTPK